jgi:hypothetical protein
VLFRLGPESCISGVCLGIGLDLVTVAACVCDSSVVCKYSYGGKNDVQECVQAKVSGYCGWVCSGLLW